jgi:hypothetical protein
MKNSGGLVPPEFIRDPDFCAAPVRFRADLGR